MGAAFPTHRLCFIVPSLVSIPRDIHIVIFEFLRDDPVTSVCLGLTCNALYSAHQRINKEKPIPLSERLTYDGGRSYVTLSALLSIWAPFTLRPYNWETGLRAEHGHGKRYEKQTVQREELYRAAHDLE